MKQRIQTVIQTVKAGMQWAKRFRLVRFLLEVFKQFSQCRVMEMAASTAYYMLFAIFPFIIFLLLMVAAIAGLLETNVDVLTSMQSFLPKEIAGVIGQVPEQLKFVHSGGLLSFGIVSLILACSKGFGVMMGNMDVLYGRKRIKSNMFFSRLLGVALALVLGFMTVLIMVMLRVVQVALQWMQTWVDWPIFRHRAMAAWLSNGVSVVIMGAFFFLILHFFSARQGYKRWAWVCGLGMSALWVVLSRVFSGSMYNSSQYTAFYGGFAGIMLFLLWIFISVLLIYTGVLIHAVGIRRLPTRRTSFPEAKDGLEAAADDKGTV